ncbi:MAG: CoA transferase [Chloroflexi bacterium]|nr:CoA transferase [Chloroflexota bacterium]
MSDMKPSPSASGEGPIQPLSAYRVLNLTDDRGSFCARILADLGADVIKIEPPQGDPSRKLNPFFHNDAHPEKSLFWFAYNANQRGVTLNIEAVEGQKLFKRLAKRAHFVVESFPPGYLDELGLGYSALSQLNPSLIMTSVTAFGQDGPYRGWKASDIVISALSGSMYLAGDPDRAPLRIGGCEQSYLVGSAYAAAGTMLAHYYRLLTGQGQHVDASAVESVSFATMGYYMYQDLEGYVFRRTGNYYDRYGKQVQLTWSCRDGYISWRLFMGGEGRFTRAVVEWMDSEGEAGELKDVKWGDIGYDAVTIEDYNRWTKLFGEFFRKHTKEAIQREALARGFSCFPVNTPKDLMENAQLKARGYWVEVECPEMDGAITAPGPLYQSSEVAWKKPGRPPLLGEHNEEIYRGELGLSREELCLLKQADVI